ncbi:MAG: hypothetical protein KAQ89_00610 [Planctomycetes bacterium]|nr:hypothetical protein [Planctomycetota bacterium]
MADQLYTLETKIDKIKKKLMALGDLRPGSLSKQYNICGNPKCRCKMDPTYRHGPYCQLSYTRKGKSGTEYIKKTNIAMVEDQIKNYKKLHTLINGWIDLSTQICQIKTEFGNQ